MNQLYLHFASKQEYEDFGLTLRQLALCTDVSYEIDKDTYYIVKSRHGSPGIMKINHFIGF